MGRAGVLLLAILVAAEGRAADFALVPIPGGTFIMGDAAGEPEERPRTATVQSFRFMRFEVTNAEFAAFVATTGYVTDPERTGRGWVWAGSWREVSGADWRNPTGPSSLIAGNEDHPVVQVSQRDAARFCRHYGMRLPSELEWEFAARGTDRRRFPWGNDPPTQEGEAHFANFGTVACCALNDSDGFATTAPIGSFPRGRSPFGIEDMAGNVWEWTADPVAGADGQVALRGGGWGNNPYCLRVSYRHGNPPDIGLDMVGFRCAADAE